MSEEDIKNILKHITVKSCELDPLPASLLAGCQRSPLPLTPSALVLFKLFSKLIMKSVLKQTTLNPKILKNYRPVSSLSFLSKVLERIVLFQHDLLFNVSETIFRQTIYSTLISQLIGHHSTGTALLKIVNNLLSAQDDSRPL